MSGNTKQQITSTLYVVFLFASSAFLFLVALVIWLITVLFDRRLLLLHLFTLWWSTLYIRIVPSWHVKVSGKENINSKKTYVIVSNHQSYLDIMVASFLMIPFKWVSKSEIFKVPFIGWNMRLNNYIPLERGGKRSIAKMMLKCEKAIQKKNSVFIFPEGTRSNDGNLKKFMPGAFVLAKRMQVDILPIAIQGTRKAVPKNSLRINNKANMLVEVLEPISFSSIAQVEAVEIAEQIQHKIAQALRRM